MSTGFQQQQSSPPTSPSTTTLKITEESRLTSVTHHSSISSQAYVMIPPSSVAETLTLHGNGESLQAALHLPFSGAGHQQLYLFPPDSSLARQLLDTKGLVKQELGNLTEETRISPSHQLLSTSSISPKSSVLGSDDKQEKSINNIEVQVDSRLSPMSVVAVSSLQDAGHPSPSLTSLTDSILSRPHQMLRYQGGGDAMLSAINYNEHDMLQEGGYEVPTTSSLTGFDGLLVPGMTVGVGGSIRLPDSTTNTTFSLLDGEVGHEAFMETSHNLHLSPQTFNPAVESSVHNENLGGISVSGKLLGSSRKPTDTNMNKLQVKSRPIKSSSPNRPGNQPCPVCNKVFANSSALTKHKLTHSDERKFVCQVCHKAFKRQDHLNGHMLTHQNKKPFACDAEGCGKSYCDARSLRRHKENHHNNNTVTQAPVTIPPQPGHIAVIPAMAHVGLTSLHSSFPTSVITSAMTPVLTESSSANRIQYAPPHGSQSHQAAIVPDSDGQLISSVVQSAASQLQFLAFHQNTPQQVEVSSDSANKHDDRQNNQGLWNPQTINTAAFLLAQNFGQNALHSQGVRNSEQTLPKRETSENVPDVIKTSGQTASLQLPDHQNQSKEINFSQQQHQQQQPGMLNSQEAQQLSPVVSKSQTSQRNTSPTVLTSHSVNSGVDTTPITSGGNLFPFLQQQEQNVFSSEMSNSLPNDSGTNSVPNTPTVPEAPHVENHTPLLQQLLTPSQPIDLIHSGQSKEQHISQQSFLPLFRTPHPAGQISYSWIQDKSYSIQNSTPTNSGINCEPKPVECSLCQRKFKNIPALNGHMRLHGGYFKKQETELKKAERKQEGSGHNPPLQTASMNVRALIEEKINQKRANIGHENSTSAVFVVKTEGTKFTFPPLEQAVQQSSEVALSSQVQAHTPQMPMLSPIPQDSPVFTNFPISDPGAFSGAPSSDASIPTTTLPSSDFEKEIGDLKQQFRIPKPPTEKTRRHSDSDHFIPPKRPCASSINNALADLIRKKAVFKRTGRTGSDPGDPPPMLEVFHAASTPTTPTQLNSTDFFSHDIFSTSLFVEAAEAFQQQQLNNTEAAHSPPPLTEDAKESFLIAEDFLRTENALTLDVNSDHQTNTLDFCTLHGDDGSSVNLVQNDIVLNVQEKRDLHGQSLEEPTVAQSASETCISLTSTDSKVNFLSVPSGLSVNSPCRMLDESNDDDNVFLSPDNLPPSPLRRKRKHRPEPLYIPPHVSTTGFHSRLRSPRLRDSAGYENKTSSPPPYTPPPMLSPVRNGSRLFWHILPGSGSLTPKSAPITPSSLLSRRVSVTAPEPLPFEEEVTDLPETDIHPHVNIGPQFQARLPMFNPNKKEALWCEHKADKLWDPSSGENWADEEIEAFLDLSCCAVVPGSGRNKEYALHLLHLSKGNLQESILMLMNCNPLFPLSHPLHTYQYTETDKWNPEEVESYHHALNKCDKDFFRMSKEIGTKTVKQCVQFYYVWKKVCPDEYKRLRSIRRKREQESIDYNLRSNLQNPVQEDTFTYNSVNTVPDNKDEMKRLETPLNNGPLKFSNQTSPLFSSMSPLLSTASGREIPVSGYEPAPQLQDQFPCQVCGRVFSKVKARSAHMKIHRPTDGNTKR